MDTKIKNITITQYHSNMGEYRFPVGFEEHLKKLMPEYDDEVYVLNDNNETQLIKAYSNECRISIITKQMRCYGWSEFKKPVEWNDPRLVAEEPDSELQRIIHPLKMDWEKLRLIVKDDMVIGVILNNTLGYQNLNDEFVWFYEDHYILPYYGYVYSSTSDNNGAGYKENDWYRYLVCLPYNHNLW